MIKKCLFVGINKYNSPDKRIQDLEGCVSDMNLMIETVKKILGNLPKDMVILTDQQATTKNVLKALEDLVNGLLPGGKAFMYFSGHGAQIPNDLRTKEDPELYDEAIVTHDFSKTAPLLDDVINSYVNLVPEGSELILVYDCCHSGGMARAPIGMGLMRAYEKEGWAVRSIGRVSRAEYSPKELKELKEYRQRYIVEKTGQRGIFLAASQKDELAWERFFGDEKHGMFTYYLCEALREMGASAVPKNLIDYAYSKIKISRGDQMPRLIGREESFSRPLFGT